MNLEKLIAYYQAKLTNPVLTAESRVIAVSTLRELNRVMQICDVISAVSTLTPEGGFDMDVDEGFEEIESILEEES